MMSMMAGGRMMGRSAPVEGRSAPVECHVDEADVVVQKTLNTKGIAHLSFQDPNFHNRAPVLRANSDHHMAPLPQAPNLKGYQESYLN